MPVLGVQERVRSLHTSSAESLMKTSRFLASPRASGSYEHSSEDMPALPAQQLKADGL